ncbi:hypothetical protein ACH95_20270 [Bacillus glycinifermentans]|uniref:Membrane protein insertion and folding monitor n=1 Tax=Bacillus glycinifermentans TaxID=1664069 RepID=A0A0J6H5A9_9BACI|nr:MULTISPECIES: hypothetical protein [Bacillus]ATH92306.1 hypothetical protein COP00_06435 [Bacillus glycinifermentans]KKB72850.1 hypothetical protein TH62_15370 [Bacillus sp. TH008]KMM54392.1 hypothetical protein ACH95_20270 [Bacillus glycinifermentans]KRT95052.1 hypothetical protein AB447_211030 [Bacillus glycinifermentans]MBU8788954.1 hypothetical protein [Bacillus glycinifermentans]
MILESFNDAFFLFEFFTIILPALTAIGIALLLKHCSTGENWKTKRIEEYKTIHFIYRIDFLVILYHRITLWISKVIRMKASSNDDEDHRFLLLAI